MSGHELGVVGDVWLVIIRLGAVWIGVIWMGVVSMEVFYLSQVSYGGMLSDGKCPRMAIVVWYLFEGIQQLSFDLNCRLR